MGTTTMGVKLDDATRETDQNGRVAYRSHAALVNKTGNL
ncbi:Uncharacterised protein [Salmonella enterica subsp. enterica]|uniref:Uncharacterized protein n=1 Tax=Salmonella enterica I TaxID=59201 RepID=A0A3S5DN07_SALET|nr:Uncharacterised protein [Salmonella enterica subsp. enterica]